MCSCVTLCVCWFCPTVFVCAFEYMGGSLGFSLGRVGEPVFVLVAKSCLTLCDPLDHSSPSVSVCGCLRAKENGLALTESWRGLPSPPPGDLPDPGIELVSPALAGRLFTTETPGKPECVHLCVRLCMFMVKCDVPSKLISKKEKEERKPCPILTLSQLVVRIPRSSPSDCTSIHPRAEVPHTPS